MTLPTPDPDDDFHNVFEFDCSENLPPELLSEFRIGRFLPVPPLAEGSDMLNEGD